MWPNLHWPLQARFARDFLKSFLKNIQNYAITPFVPFIHSVCRADRRG
jgi:hypothetical protein